MVYMKNTNGPSDEYLATFSPIEVKVSQNGRVEDAIRRFRSMVTKERIMSDLKEHQTFEKPSMKKRRKQRESLARQRKMDSFAADSRVRNAKENCGEKQQKQTD